MARKRIVDGQILTLEANEQPWRRWFGEVPLFHWGVVALLTVLAIWIRLRFLDGPMRYDEAFTVWRYATRPLVNVIASYSLPNNHIFHTVLVHFATQIGGIQPEVVRIPALSAGVLMVPAGFILFGRIAGLVAGLFSSALIAGSSLLIDYSVNARGYTIAALLSLLALGLITEIRRGSLGPWSTPVLVLTGFVGALGLWTIPVFTYPWAVAMIWLIAPSEGRSVGRRVLDAVTIGVVSAGVAMVLYLPVILNDGLDALTGNRFVRPEPLADSLERFPGFVNSVWNLWIHNLPAALVLVLAVGLLFALWGSGARAVRRLGWSVVVGVLGVQALVLTTPRPRVWVVILPIVLGVSAAGLGVLFDRLPLPYSRARLVAGAVALSISVVMVASVVSASGSLSGQSDGLVDAESIVLDLEPLVTATDYVAAVIPSTAPLRYYFELHGLPGGALRKPEVLPSEIYVVATSSQQIPDVLGVVGIASVDVDPHLISAYPSGSLWRVRIPAESGQASRQVIGVSDPSHESGPLHTVAVRSESWLTFCAGCITGA